MVSILATMGTIKAMEPEFRTAQAFERHALTASVFWRWHGERKKRPLGR